MICSMNRHEKGRKRAIDNMGSTLNTPPAVLKRLHRLTGREREVCVLHFVDGRSQTCIAEWLGITLRVVQRHITRAVAKVPELGPLRVQSSIKPQRPKIFHLSQLRPTERGPFNADEV
jgi:DNA-binding CsgD family transcriptional regulator